MLLQPRHLLIDKPPMASQDGMAMETVTISARKRCCRKAMVF